jgi:penicillin-binding protein 2
MSLEFDESFFKKNNDVKISHKKVGKNFVKKILERDKQLNDDVENDGNGDGIKWNFLILLVSFSVLLFLLLFNVFRLQVVEGNLMYERSERNQIHIINIPARRGIIFDRNGEKLVENNPSVDCFVDLKSFLDEEGILNDELLRENVTRVQSMLGENWILDIDEEYSSILERIYVVLEKDPDTEVVLIASNVSNDVVIEMKARSDEILGVYLDEGVSRYYPHKDFLTHVLGYTGIVTAEDFQTLDYVGFNDLVGRTGIEKSYDADLIGMKGQMAVEVNALGQVVSKGEMLVRDMVPGKSLYLSLDINAQRKAYEILQEGLDTYGATSASMIVQDVSNGEILVMSNFPSYDNNLFVQGISQEDFETILFADGAPFTNKAIAAQVPPGSMFKPLVAAAALDAGAITRDTVYVSRAGYSFSSGAPFQEFQGKVYGSLNLVDAIMLSSNIYFCETIRNWDMNKLVPYLKYFGIGEYTGIDIPGEGPGRLPSPENKVELSKTSSPWLEPYWYPEGDSCNSVIGQGITTVTPIQAVSWTSTIANGGTFYTPHLGKKLFDNEGKETNLEFEKIREDFISKDALKVVREGMRESVAGSRKVIVPLTDAKVEVAAKTGTAEFGKLSSEGIYEHTHAWVSGFFPYEEPKYSFVVFLEDGGASNNSAQLAREFIDWFVENGFL